MPTESPVRTQAADLPQLEALFIRRDLPAAARLARAILRDHPRQPFAWKVLASCLAAHGDLHAAVQMYRDAPASLDNDWQFHNNFGSALKAQTHLGQAAAHYRRAIALNLDCGEPPAIEPFFNLGVTLLEAGDLQGAERCLRQVLRLRPDHGPAQANLANILNAQERRAEAEVLYRAAMRTMPEDPRLLNNLGQLLAKAARFAEAEDLYRRAIAVEEGFAPACVNLAELMAQHGLVAEAETLLRHALALDPTLAKAHSNLLFVMALRDNCDPAALYTEHRRFAAQFEAPLKSAWPQHTNPRDPAKRLRVGFVSGDLRDHPVVRYLLPALQRLFLQPDLELIAYKTGVLQDSFTAAYRDLFHEWRDVALVPDAVLAGQIEADRIDILIDLSGHSGDNRLLTFARKPAPVQMTWIGYVGTTGLDAIDYFIGDENLAPPAMHHQFREKLLYLPATTTFDPYEPAVPRNELPALTRGHFTFCCAARINKLNAPLIALWSRAMHAVPGSRMLLLTLSGGGIPERVVAWFAEHGIARDRLTFVHARSVQDILRLHHDADLGLDTYPYNGSTTISHALTMGVPTLTLRGTVPGARLGASIALHTGLPQMIATSHDEFVLKAMFWSSNLPTLALLRRELPERFAASSLRQHDLLATTLATKLRQAWTRWCNGLPAEHL